jgi:hypothetical protein
MPEITLISGFWFPISGFCRRRIASMIGFELGSATRHP